MLLTAQMYIYIVTFTLCKLALSHSGSIGFQHVRENDARHQVQVHLLKLVRNMTRDTDLTSSRYLLDIIRTIENNSLIPLFAFCDLSLLHLEHWAFIKVYNGARRMERQRLGEEK